MPVNWEAQRRMDEDLEENPELYAALAGEDPRDEDPDGEQEAESGVNWEAQRDMQRDVEENPELYAALAGKVPGDEDTSNNE